MLIVCNNNVISSVVECCAWVVYGVYGLCLCVGVLGDMLFMYVMYS